MTPRFLPRQLVTSNLRLRAEAVRTCVGVTIALLVAPIAEPLFPQQQLPRPRPIPAVSLEEMEPAVRDQLEEQLEAQTAALEKFAAGDNSGSLRSLAMAYGELGELFLLYDLGEAAEASLSNAADFDPLEPRWIYLLGTLSELNGSLDTAINRYSKALDLAKDRGTSSPVLNSIRARLGRSLLQSERFEEAMPLLQALLEEPNFRAFSLAGRGRLAAETGDHAQAVQLLSAALAEQPKANQLHYQLGLSYRALGQLEQARFHLANRGDGSISFPDPIAMDVQSKVGGAGAMLTLGRISMATGEVEVAEQRFRRAVAIDPNNGAAHQALAGLLLARNDVAAALAEYEEAVKASPDDAGLRYRVAQLLIDAPTENLETRKANLERAIGHLTESTLLAPDANEVRVLLARTLLTVGKFDEADAIFKKGIERDPLALNLHFGRAQAFADRLANAAAAGSSQIEQYGEAGRAALADFSNALERTGQPLPAATRLELGLLQLRLGDSLAGRQTLTELLTAGSPEAHSTEARAIAARAAFYLANEAAQRVGEPVDAADSALSDSALAMYRKAIDLDPSLLQAYSNYGLLLARLERYEEAAQQYEALIVLDQQNESARFSEAMALIMAGEHQKARAHLEAGLEAIPSSPLLGHLLARLLVTSPVDEVRDGDVGLDLALRLFEAFPTPEYGETVAMALAETGQFQKAVDWQTRVIEELSKSDAHSAVAARRLEAYRAQRPMRSPWLD